MADEDKDQRTEEPTDKKRSDSFEKGQTAQSKEVSSTVVLFATAMLLYISGTYIRENLSLAMKTAFTTFMENPLTIDNLRPMTMFYLALMAKTLAPVMLAAAIGGIIISIAQNGGLILTVEPIMPKWSKLNVIKGFGRFFSKQAAMELFKSLGKVAIVSTVCYKVLSQEWENLPKLIDQDIEQIFVFIGWVALKLMLYVLLIMLVLAIADLAFQRYTFEESIKMTKQEVKDERKSMEGDPQTKGRIRSVQVQLAKRRMMADVPKAEVIITNPTHLAIAIAYDRIGMNAPIIVAKGAGQVAAKIREIAKENDIPIVEDKPLARFLFKTVDIGSAIPEEMYKAIAEILAYVYRLKGKSL